MIQKNKKIYSEIKFAKRTKNSSNGKKSKHAHICAVFEIRIDLEWSKTI